MAQRGKIAAIVDSGSIIQVLCLTDDGRLFPVNFDWRMFVHFAGAQNGNLKGLEVEFDGERVRVLDD